MENLQRLFQISVEKNLNLRLAMPADANALEKVIEENRDHLAKYLPWVKINTLNDLKKFLTNAIDLFGQGKMFEYLIVKGTEIVGIAEINEVNQNERSAEVGYWLASNFCHQGIMTKSIKVLIREISEVLKLHRFVIRTDVDNEPSRKLAVSAGFSFEGIRKEDHFSAGQFYDSAVYYYLVKNGK
ncbi:GNAT family N-acetyltransferase [Xylocopilactobacillus apis]|uniref:Ribosomal protein acetylating enzyme n=1 Tax=Xylocopilactobacillus apis TaxID=2932183 RepID=A0AAU9DD34_9LACO|nr:GNAT family protein [Xylocopilactobacillus apis]BDR56056.1 ribosomal protein acetylating enzyme [Xylocopilactobacillus apis]